MTRPGPVSREDYQGERCSELIQAFHAICARTRRRIYCWSDRDEDGLLKTCHGRIYRDVCTSAVTRTRPSYYVAAADVLSLPSHREGFGSVIIEAAAAGVPAVASRIYGITDAVIEGETGFLATALETWRI